MPFEDESMTDNFNTCVPEPVLFNTLKHHAGFLAGLIRDFDISRPENRIILKESVNAIGKSQMDLYTGSLPPEQIAGEITDYLEKNRLLDESAYLSRLRSEKPYLLTRLSDTSVWVLLPGRIKGRHVHIHPGRHSPHTIRVRSETLKSVIAILCLCSRFGKDPLDINSVNQARVEILGLSPVRDISACAGIGKLTLILSGKL
jgi:hypothetical protein